MSGCQSSVSEMMDATTALNSKSDLDGDSTSKDRMIHRSENKANDKAAPMLAQSKTGTDDIDVLQVRFTREFE